MLASTGQRQVQVSKSVLNVYQARTRPVEILCVNNVLLDRTRNSMVLRGVTRVPWVNTRAVEVLPVARRAMPDRRRNTEEVPAA